jgi:hypothetical protein
MGVGRTWEGLCTEPEGELVLGEGSPSRLSVQRGRGMLQQALGATRAMEACGEVLWALATETPQCGVSSVPDGFCDLGQVPSLLQI